MQKSAVKFLRKVTCSSDMNFTEHDTTRQRCSHSQDNTLDYRHGGTMTRQQSNLNRMEAIKLEPMGEVCDESKPPQTIPIPGQVEIQSPSPSHSSQEA